MNPFRPVITVHAGAGVADSDVGYALDRLRELTSASLVAVDEAEVWLDRPGHPVMPAALLATCLVRSGSQWIKCRGVAADPLRAIDTLCARLRARLGVVPRQRESAAEAV